MTLLVVLSCIIAILIVVSFFYNFRDWDTLSTSKQTKAIYTLIFMRFCMLSILGFYLVYIYHLKNI